MGGQHHQRGLRPKIAALLSGAAAAAARVELEICEKLGISPSQFRGRPTVATYLYDDEGRVSRVVQSSPWTVEDRALMLAWREYQDGICSGCGHPKATAWHPDNEGWFEAERWVTCWGCTAGHEPDSAGHVTPVKIPLVEDTRDYAAKPLPPWPEPD